MTDEPTKIVVTTTLPIPTRDALKVIADRNDRSVSAEVKRAVDAHVARETEASDLPVAA